MSHNTRTHNSGQDVDQRRSNPSQYNLRPLHPQVEEQQGDELPPVAERKATRCQPRREMRTKCLEHHLDTLTKLVSTLVMTLGQNAVNVASAIPLRIPLANAEPKRRDAMASEA